MPTIINNEASTSYQLAGSSTVETAVSNQNTVTLQDYQGLDITKTADPTTLAAGQIITYTVQITNSSSSFLNGVRIIDNLGGGNLAYVIGSARLTASGTTYAVTPVATNPLTFTLQQLAVGQTMTLVYRAQVIFNLPATTTSVTNTIQGIGYTASGTITGFANATIQRPSSVGVVVTKTSNESMVFPQQPLRYTIVLSNNSSVSASIQEITDQLPANFNVTSVALRIGSGPITTLDESEYELTGTNFLTIPSSTGPIITIPAGSTASVIISGYFN